MENNKDFNNNTNTNNKAVVNNNAKVNNNVSINNKTAVNNNANQNNKANANMNNNANSNKNINSNANLNNNKNFNNNTNVNNKNDGESLYIISKMENYIQFMLDVIMKMPRIEKFNLGNEYKTSMYEMIRDALFVGKVKKTDRLDYLNKIDAELNCQRIYLRLMRKNGWIGNKQFIYVMNTLIHEIGQMLGGLIKYYAKYYSKPV